LYSCCSHLQHRASVKHFVSLQFLNLRQWLRRLGRGISPSQGRYLTKQNKRRQTAIALSGIGTHDPSVRGRKDISCLRPHGHCDRPYSSYFYVFITLSSSINFCGKLPLYYHAVLMLASSPWERVRPCPLIRDLWRQAL
jgi:hypothetical protein